MKTFITVFIIFFTFSAIAQKDKPILASFISDQELLVAFSSGVNIVYNVPELSVKRKFSPSDKKNKTALAELSPKNDRLVVFDSKIKKRIFWDTETGKQVFEIKSTYNSPSGFKGDSHFIIGLNKNINELSFKIFDIQTGNLTGDLDNLELPYRGMALSPSGSLLINYDNSSLGSGGYAIVDFMNDNRLIKNSLDKDQTQIGAVRFKESEDSVKVYYRAHMSTAGYNSYMIPTRADVDLSDYPQSDYSFNNTSSQNLSVDNLNFGFTKGNEIWIPMDNKDYYQISNWDTSPSGKWSFFIGSKGLMLVFDHEDTEPIEKNGETLKKPKEVTRITTD